MRTRILHYLRERVATSENPTKLAETLHGELRGLWRFRIGNYRVIADIQRTIEIVEVLDVGHRSNVYKKTGR